jgi:hypothetical protein
LRSGYLPVRNPLEYFELFLVGVGLPSPADAWVILVLSYSDHLQSGNRRCSYFSEGSSQLCPSLKRFSTLFGGVGNDNPNLSLNRLCWGAVSLLEGT